MHNVLDEIGVEMAPAEVAQGLYIVPLFSWYNHHFDTADPRPGGVRFDKFCKWPFHDLNVWEYMLQLNNQRVRKYKRNSDEKVLLMFLDKSYAFRN